jgi:hypothetical protein
MSLRVNSKPDVVSLTREEVPGVILPWFQYHLKTTQKPVVIRVVYRGLRKTGCRPPVKTEKPIYDAAYAELLSTMQKIEEPTSRQPVDENVFTLLTLSSSQQDEDTLENFFNCFHGDGNAQKQMPFNMTPYLKPGSKTCPYRHFDCRSRKDVFESGRPAALPAYAYSKNVTEKQVCLAHGTMVEHLYHQTQANRFSDAITSVRFVSFQGSGTKLTYALIRASKMVFKKTCIDEAEDEASAERTRVLLRKYLMTTAEVSLLVKLQGSDHPVSLRGQTVFLRGDRWSKVNFYLALAIKSVPNRVPVHNLNEESVPRCRWRPVKFNTNISDDALAQTFHGHCPAVARPCAIP